MENNAQLDELEIGEDWQECWNCGSTGYSRHDCGDDTCCCLEPDPNVLCEICEGLGGWPTHNDEN